MIVAGLQGPGPRVAVCVVLNCFEGLLCEQLPGPDFPPLRINVVLLSVVRSLVTDKGPV